MGVSESIEIDDEEFEFTEEELDAFIEMTDLESLDENIDINEEFEEVFNQLDERGPLNISQRMAIGRRMKRLAPRMKRQREIRKKRMADKPRLEKRSRKAAIKLLRKRFAGKQGQNYASLSPGAKMSVDRVIQKKMSMVSKISKRLLPKIRKAEMERLKKARSGPKKESIDTRFELMISESTQAPIQMIWEEEDEGTNSKLVTMLRQAFRDPTERMLVIRALKGGSKSLQNPKLRPFILKLLNRLLDATQDDPSMFAKMREKLRRMSQADEKEANESFKAFTNLKKKSDMTGIPLDVILEVFEREDNPDLGFNRVNSFINGGKAWELDADLAEKVKESTSKLKDACWTGYTAVGTKKKNGKTVPNCVPKEEVEEAKSPLQRLKDFDKTRAAVGKKPIFKDNEKKKPEVKEQQAEKAAKARIAREKEADKVKHDRMLDMARTRDTQAKNRQSMRKEDIDNIFQTYLEHPNCGTPDCCGQCDTATNDLTEGFTAGISDTMFATEFDQNQIQGSFSYHPSVMEEGGAGEWGTDEFVKKYKEETPNEEVEIYDGDDFFKAYNVMWYNEDEELDEAEYQGRKVTLGKPMAGDVKKFKVYVKSPSTGNIKKVEFGDPNMTIKKHIPSRRKSFRARHNCDNPGPRDKARYWSCKKW